MNLQTDYYNFCKILFGAIRISPRYGDSSAKLRNAREHDTWQPGHGDGIMFNQSTIGLSSF